MYVLIIFMYICYMPKEIRRNYYLDKLFYYKDKDIIKVVTGLHLSGTFTNLRNINLNKTL